MKVVGVSFRHQCKMYWFGAKDENIARGAHVIVETEQGKAYADVVVATTEMAEEDLPETVKPILRVATKDDDDQQKLNEKNEAEAVVICKQKVKEHEKEMKIIRAMYAFDRTKLTFYFTADGRVDFVALVKDLAHEFRTRIELRQVGVRDETRLLGGIGVCGRELCCATWLSNFVQVPIKAAKEQNLSLNTAKISGFCGRLMCCLKNEEDTYRYLNSKLPDLNQTVKTRTGEKGVVKSTNILKQKVSVLFGEGEEEKELREYDVTDLIFAPSKKKQYEEEKEQQDCEACGKCEGKNKIDDVSENENIYSDAPDKQENQLPVSETIKPQLNAVSESHRFDNHQQKKPFKAHANRYNKAIAKNNRPQEERKMDLEELIALEEEKEKQTSAENGEQKPAHKKKYWNNKKKNYWHKNKKQDGQRNE